MAQAVAAAAAFLLAALLVASPLAAAAANHDIPAVFAFGDSTLDPGNNNGMTTLVRADHAPYGCDFPGGAATGRFSDGKLITDYIVESLGIKDLLPAHHDTGVTVEEQATGVSFASGGSGIDDLTAQTAMVSTFGSQISDFRGLLARIGSPRANEIANKSLYVVSTGTNDVTMNYFILQGRTGSFPTIDQYSDYLIDRLQGYIQNLYDLGARNFMVAGLPPVGCLPVMRTLSNLGSGDCVADQNAAAERYNAALQQMLAKLEAASPGATLAYVDVYTPLRDMAAQPQKYGFTETGQGCCGNGLPAMGALCISLLPQCLSPAQYMFFDSVHPTQTTYKALADHIVQSHIPKFIK
ncbi:hypothetical protein SETIT_3G210100v2 [Setaria italica]|uniref:GDSL esterase/lipase n=1 Tax=Setaria italica TaxID=4555 RepID=K3ZEU2_SETIT|nr:GDSL esterase/lipase At2g40250 [Setaria italica]RCV17313.1 hypothetical protein SETIT_3G210100v2 [Setaria italica]